MNDIKRVRDIGHRRLSDRVVKKQLKRIAKVAEDDSWTDEFLSYSRPMPVGGEYIMPPERAKEMLVGIYGEGSDIQNLNFDDDEDYEEDKSADRTQEEMDVLEQMRRKPDPSKWPGATKRKVRVDFANIPGVQRSVVSMAREIGTGHGTLGVVGGSCSEEHQDCWVSGASVRYEIGRAHV